jgi:hypothetical protein
MKVAIFGSGPSGLLAAHAAHAIGYEADEIEIFSEGRKSMLYGCQYLHQPIPDLSDPDDFVDVDYQLVGTPAAYWLKVYGDQKIGTVSAEELGSHHKAWDIREAYDLLWDFWSERIQPVVLSPMQVADLEFSHFIDTFDLVINTVPRNIWCTKTHDFKVTEIWAMGDAPYLGIRTPFRVHNDNSVICNGLHDVGWYRMSRVFDHNTIEWPSRRKPPVSGVVKVTKPTSTNCDCWEGRVAHFGRYGEWKKGVLAHQVYDDAEKLFISARVV